MQGGAAPPARVRGASVFRIVQASGLPLTVWLRRAAFVIAVLLLPALAHAAPRSQAFAWPGPAAADTAAGDSSRPVIAVEALQFFNYTLFLDPAPNVATKEFALLYNGVPDTNIGPGRVRGMFHLIYQRSGGPQSGETSMGHGWSTDLIHWTVDTLAFTIDSTAWNAKHVWSPSLVHFEGKDYLFYTGVDANDDQRIGFASTAILDTSNTIWDPQRVMVLEASRTNWAVPDPATYVGQTQFRDAFVMNDPEHPSQLLMFYSAHDSVDFKLGQGGLVVGLARSAPHDPTSWTDLGYYKGTHRSITKVGQLEGPHVFPARGTNTGWRLMYSNAGTPPGENGSTTIRFEPLLPGASLADTSLAAWGAPVVLRTYLSNNNITYGWSSSEYLRVGGVDYLGGFTAWGPVMQGIALTRMTWTGDNFTLNRPFVTAVDEHRSPTRGLTLEVRDEVRRAGRVTFHVDSPLTIDARLELYDAQGRRVQTVFAGALPQGRSQHVWDLSALDGGRVASGMYFARLAFAGGVRATPVAVIR